MHRGSVSAYDVPLRTAHQVHSLRHPGGRGGLCWYCYYTTTPLLQVGPWPLLAAVAVVVLALSLLHPDPRPTNSAYTEACKFAGLYLGAVAAGTTG